MHHPTEAKSQEVIIEEEDSSAGEENMSGIDGPVFDAGGLTTIQSWKPSTSTVEFMSAEVCHDLKNDIYGIAAIFRNTTQYVLYYIRVDGKSGSPTYGQRISTRFIESSATGIYNVDCTQDGQDKIFITWDKYNSYSRWLRMQGNTPSVLYSVTPRLACSDIAPGVISYSSKPRITYQDELGYATVTIAFYGYNYDTAGRTCEVCTQTFNANTGSYINEDQDGVFGHPVAWDIEWNGDEYFILVYVYGYDGDGIPMVHAQELFWDGTIVTPNEDHLLQDCHDFNVPCPETVRLVYTDGNKNTLHRFTLQSDAVYKGGPYEGTHVGSTFWLEQSGVLTTGTPNPRFAYGGRYDLGFAACEYWGDTSDRIAHAFSSIYSFYYPPPIYIINTRHMHWGTEPSYNNPFESYTLNDGYWPKACNAADTTGNDEVLLVSRKAPSADPYVYWNIEAQ